MLLAAFYPLLPELALGLLAVLLLAWLAARASQPELEISADNRRYRRVVRLRGLRLGCWQPLPPVVGVTLKYFVQRGSGPAPSATSWGTWDSSNSRSEQLLVLLSLQNSATGLVAGRFAADDQAAASRQGQQLASRFGVPLHEYLASQHTGRR